MIQITEDNLRAYLRKYPAEVQDAVVQGWVRDERRRQQKSPL